MIKQVGSCVDGVLSGYDTLGRTTTLPAVDSPTSTAATMTCYTNDLVATVTTGTTTRANALVLDATGRIAS